MSGYYKGIKTSYWEAPVLKNYAYNSADKILSLVCAEFNVKLSDIVSRTRKQDIVVARHAYVYLANEKLRKRNNINSATYHYKDIGAKIYRDHATIINSIKVVNNIISYDKQFKAKIEGCLTKITEQYEIL